LNAKTHAVILGVPNLADLLPCWPNIATSPGQLERMNLDDGACDR